MGMENQNTNRKPKISSIGSKSVDKFKLWPPVVIPTSYDVFVSYDWKDYLEKPDFETPPVQTFTHVPLHDVWRFIVPSIKVEVPNRDYWAHAGSIGGVFWIATVIKMIGYKALLRYEGFNEDSSQDFWMNVCSADLHNVGWCAREGKPLVPPKMIVDRQLDWKTFLVKKLTGSKTLPTNFQDRIRQSLACKLRPGLTVEVIDRNQLSRYRPGVVKEVIGRRIRVNYVEPVETEIEPDQASASSPAQQNVSFIWCHETSQLVRPVGWCLRVGVPLYSTGDYRKRCQEKINAGRFDPNDATEEYFTDSTKTVKNEDDARYSSLLKFEEKMKLEALDVYNNYYTIAPATVSKVLKDDYLQITFDGTGDNLIVKTNSPYIFPIGFCEANGILLTTPEGYDKVFGWESYLRETNSIGAPAALFNQEIVHHQFKVGQKLEATDNVDPHLICVATVAEVKGRLLKIHYDGWADNFDQWVHASSTELFPVGWCETVGYPLEPPAGNTVVRGKRLLSGGQKPKKHKKMKYDNGDRSSKGGESESGDDKVEAESAGEIDDGSDV